ncbi:MAG: outer membrane beta-barrel domain-containing protein [Deltaproteobacteria bacterium]|nr:outer membrane beta-barrel domain-containing protein [Deltaproteobacteria bacterium]NCP02279.1 outer membrane beta-barrel domain-containing protein [Deltaproteobacteria bacterium]
MDNKISFVSVARNIALALVLTSFLLPTAARAEIKAGSLELSPFVGYSFFEDRQNLNNRPVFGGRIGYNLTDRWGIEGVTEFTRGRVDDVNQAFTQKGQFTSPISRVDIINYHADLLLHFLPKSNFNPFIVAGFGAMNYDPKINDDDMTVFNYGVGAKYWLEKDVALRLDLRDNLILDDEIHNPEATLGIVFSFGGQSHFAAAPAPVAVSKPASKPVAKVEEKVVILASEPKVEEKVLVAAVEPKVIILAFEDVHFDFDQSALKPEAKVILKRNIQLLKDNPKAKIRIAGYTSQQGTDEYNQKLSERRAEAVKAYLVEEGIIVPGRLDTIGYGHRDPAVYEAAPAEIYSAAAKANMRVLFEIIVK